MTWGLSNGQFSASKLAQSAKERGFGWVALQADDFGNDAHAVELRQDCAMHGLLFGIWETSPAPELDRVGKFGAQFYIAEVESREDFVRLVDGLAALARPRVPLAIVTNFNGFSSAEAQTLRDLYRVHCLPEADLPGNPNATPERVVARAEQEFGWPLEQIQPVCYLNGGKTLADYGALGRWAGYGVWAAEYLLL